VVIPQNVKKSQNHCTLLCTSTIQITSVADPHHVDPDPAFHFDADADPDPTFHLDVDPSPNSTYHFDVDLNPFSL
jgi:hypothetical protein